jgi:uncharacterized membrane protein YfcA
MFRLPSRRKRDRRRPVDHSTRGSAEATAGTTVNRALAILALVGAAAVVAGNLIQHHHDWGYALVLFGGMLMGFCLGFYLAARTVREALRASQLERRKRS